jgi:hypothetical protein
MALARWLCMVEPAARALLLPPLLRTARSADWCSRELGSHRVR